MRTNNFKLYVLATAFCTASTSLHADEVKSMQGNKYLSQASESAQSYENQENRAEKNQTTSCSSCFNDQTRFSKKYKGEVDVFGGSYLGNLSENSWSIGGRVFFSPISLLNLGVEYLYPNLIVDAASSFGQVKTTNQQHIIDGQMAFNFPMLLGVGNSRVPMTLYATVGTGAININNEWNWLGVIGGGLKIHLPPRWLAIRIDVNSYLHNTPVVGGKKFGSDFAALIGLAFLMP